MINVNKLSLIVASILLLVDCQQYQPTYNTQYDPNVQVQQGQQRQQQYPNPQYGTFNQDRGAFYEPSNALAERTQFNLFRNTIDGVDENLYCPEHWLANRQKCYRFIKSPRRSWYEAKKICKAYNADLVNIDTIDKHSFIIKQLILENQVQNRYYISAKQVAPNNWANDDGTTLLQLDDSFSFDPEDYMEEGAYLNYRIQNLDQPNHFHRNTHLRDSEIRELYGDRVVYAYSRRKDRWMFMPSHDYDSNLFICESSQLYNANNINLMIDRDRKIHYGFEIVDFEEIPRGPSFVKQPVDTIYDTSQVGYENFITLSCLASGFPTPTYTWYKEEYLNDVLRFTRIDPIEDDRFILTGGNLIVFNPEQSLHQGIYHCVAENKYGRVRSESAQLNFGFIMEFNLKRSPETGDMNWGKSLFCDPPQHYPDVKYYWSRDFFPNFVEEDQRVFVSYDGALYFSSLEQVDRANYSCTVQSLVSRAGRNGPFFPLRVYPKSDYQALIFANTFPKMFPEAPVAGEDIRLECMAFGYPVPNYNWTRTGGLPRNAYQTSYNRVLVIPNATLNDNGEYTCTIENNRKLFTKSILVNIQMKPNFTIPLRDMIKDYNSEATFICEAAAVPDVNYTWYKNAELLDIEKLNQDRFTIQDNVLILKYLDPDNDDGMYQCRAENQLKSVYSSAQLRVLSMKPSFKKKPLESEIYALYNGNTTISCDPEAAPRPKFQWKKDGVVIGPGGHRRIQPTGTLIITPTSRDDEGIYTCVASNSNGTDESRTRLIVLQELRFVQPLPPLIITQIGDYIYMRCEVSYDEILDVAFVWKHNEQIIEENEDPRVAINYNSLTIFNVTLLDAGDYECIAKSSVNQISSTSRVKVEGPPGAPGGVSVVEVRKTTAIIEWVDGSDNGRRILYYNVLGRTNWNKTWVNVTTELQAHEVDRYTGRKQGQVTNLTPWSGYEFSVCAVNELGIGAPSAPSPLYSTQDDRPYVSPSNVGGGGGKIGDLTIKWDPLMPQQQNSRGIHYKIFWKLHTKTIEWSSLILKEQGNVGTAVVQISYDNYYTEYDVKVQAINDVGSGPESEIVTIYSAEDMPQLAPQKPIARSFNSTALNVTWEPVDESREKMRGKLIGHRLKYWRTDLLEEDAVYYLSRTTRPWALIVGLQPDTYYLVKVMAYNSAGEGPESERYLERTYRKAPQKPPTSVNIYAVDPSTVRVVWRYVAPTSEEEPIQGYKVRVWEADQDMTTANDTIVLVGNRLECYVDKLTPGKMFNLRVLAFSNGGDGRMSSPALSFQMGKTKEHERMNSSDKTKFNAMILTVSLAILSLYHSIMKI